nr:Mur ligase family protein [Shimazuella alba]
MNPKVIGITGSAGKSTTTAMVASILHQHYQMVRTDGNLNTFTFPISLYALGQTPD